MTPDQYVIFASVLFGLAIIACTVALVRELRQGRDR